VCICCLPLPNHFSCISISLYLYFAHRSEISALKVTFYVSIFFIMPTFYGIWLWTTLAIHILFCKMKYTKNANSPSRMYLYSQTVMSLQQIWQWTNYSFFPSSIILPHHNYYSCFKFLGAKLLYNKLCLSVCLSEHDNGYIIFHNDSLPFLGNVQFLNWHPPPLPFPPPSTPSHPPFTHYFLKGPGGKCNI
jgi:hypothetical protein